MPPGSVRNTRNGHVKNLRLAIKQVYSSQEPDAVEADNVNDPGQGHYSSCTREVMRGRRKPAGGDIIR